MIASLPRTAASLLALLLAAPLAAQEPTTQGAPAPAPPVAPAVSEGPAVLLAYKFKPGQVQRFRANLTSAMTMMMSGGPAGAQGGPGAIPLDMSGTLGYTEKVLGTRQGTATLRIEPSAMQFSANVMGNSIVSKLVNGKIVTTQNGQPLPPGAQVPGMMSGAAGSGPATIFRTPTGEVSQRGGGLTGGGAANPFLGGAAQGAVAQFPDHPVRVGESWETTKQFSGAGLGPALPGGDGAPVEVRMTHTLKEILQKGTRRIAIIETTGSSSAGAPGAPGNGGAPATAPNAADPSAAPALTQSLTGVTYFDVDRGALITSRFTSDISANITIPLPIPAPDGAAAGGAGAPPGISLKMEGQIGLKVAEIPNTPATAGKRPTSTRTRARRGR